MGVKSTCINRWRQVLAEADRIDHKHLLTLEASISRHQTDEMQAKNLQLVLPRGLHETYARATGVAYGYCFIYRLGARATECRLTSDHP